MKKIFFLFLLLTSIKIFAQSFSDDFEDADITDWNGDIASFIVTAGELQLNGDCVSGGENYLSVPVATEDSAVWEFYVRCAFDPSTSNYAKIYLQSDNANLTGDLNGYFIQIGGVSGSLDAVDLFRQEGATETLVLSGAEGAAAVAPEIGIKIVRSNAGEWKLSTDYSGGTAYTFETSVIDTEINGGDYLGVVCKYSSTRCTSFYFDNFFADPLYTDIDAPLITELTVLSSSELEILFSENVEETSAEDNSNYTVDGGVGNPVNATQDIIDNKKVTLTFTDNFPEAILLTLSVSGVEDDAGNAIALEEAQFNYYTVHQYDVLIDEIFADETPVIGLPEAEYIELYNRTDLNIDLADWKIKDATDSSDAFSTFILEPNAYVIITDDANISLFTSYAEVIGINNFPSLNNDGDLLSLCNNNYQLIHNVNYS
ncbi:MAG: lamin tail domain-containing protein, partial [Fimbriimonadaceae bacterium]|nr:lamin tail domain-containing protein [Chitinophagales bacterium]